MKGRTLSLVIGSLVLFLSTIACALNLGGPTYPATSVPISADAATQAQQAIETADAQSAQTGKLTFTLTQEQATSYLAEQLQQQTDAPITNPQVFFRDGQMEIYGTVNQGIVTATAKVVVTITVDPQGQPVIELTSATFGPFPVPPGMRDMITNNVRDAYASAVGSAITHFRLGSVTIADGKMTLEGVVK